MGKLAVITTNNQGVQEDLYPITLPQGVIDDKDKRPLSEDLHKIKDKEYNKSDYSGLGRVYLEKNIKEGKNILTQEMISKENTIYIIEYDFDLNGAEITIPEGCTLDFQGGNFSNGSVIGNNTAIKAELVKIFGLDINLSGNWNVLEAYPEWFGAKGDAVANDTSELQKSIDMAYAINRPTKITNKYRSDSLVIKCDLIGNIKSSIIFNIGHNFRNYEADGSVKYHIKKIYGIIFESDKSCYWNRDNAKDSYLDAITDIDVKRKYGQRVFIGNKTSPLADNNIRALKEKDAMEGTGEFSNDYSQWVQATYVNHNKLYTNFEELSDKFVDANVLSCPEGVVIERCYFAGFTTGLVTCGTYGSIIKDSYFYRCKIGVIAYNSSILPGNLQSSGSKTTTLVITKCIFEDIYIAAIYGNDLQESKVDNCIFERVPVCIVLNAGTMNNVDNNYFEIVHTGVHILSDDATYNIIDSNFAHKSLIVYHCYMRYGSYNKVINCKWNGNVYADANIRNCDFDDSVTIQDNSFDYFYTNGNSFNRDKVKYAIWRVDGNGTAVDATPLSCSRKYGIFPKIKFSEGFSMNETYNHENVLDVILSNKISFVSYVNPSKSLNSGWFDVLNTETGKPTLYDLRNNGNSAIIKILFTDGYDTEIK